MKSKFKTFIYLAIVLIVVGFVGFILMRFPRFFYFEGSPDGWLSYWGGIFGSVIGVIGALIVLREQINIEKVDNTFFNLLNIHNDIVKSIRKSEAKTSIFDKAYYSIVKNKEKYINEKEYDKIYLFVEFNKNDFIESITLMKESINNLDYNDMVVDYIYGREYFEIQIKEIEEFLSLIYPKLEKSLKCLNWSEALHYINYTYNVVFINDRYSMLTSLFADSFGKFAELYNKMYQQVNFTFNEESKKEVVELSLQEYYGELGSYFRTFHRIIKFVNENVKDIDSKANYIGFLRAMLNEKEIIVIFYNAFYSKRGKGLDDQLKYTDFFGDKKDFPTKKNLDAQHFNKKLLLWEKSDIEKMKTLKLQRMPGKFQKRIIKILDRIKN